MFTVMRIPKCMGSIPSFTATGKRVGAMIRMMDDGSITFPAISNSKFNDQQYQFR